MTLGLQLLLIFQCPGLSNPLANFVFRVRGGVGCWRRMDMDVATGSESRFLMDGPFLPSTWPDCADL